MLDRLVDVADWWWSALWLPVVAVVLLLALAGSIP